MPLSLLPPGGGARRTWLRSVGALGPLDAFRGSFRIRARRRPRRGAPTRAVGQFDRGRRMRDTAAARRTPNHHHNPRFPTAYPPGFQSTRAERRSQFAVSISRFCPPPTAWRVGRRSSLRAPLARARPLPSSPRSPLRSPLSSLPGDVRRSSLSRAGQPTGRSWLLISCRRWLASSWRCAVVPHLPQQAKSAPCGGCCFRA